MRTLSKTVLLAVTIAVAMNSCKKNEAKKNVEIDTMREVRQQQETTADVANQGFIDGMTGKVWNNYLQVKMALIEGDASVAQKAAGDMAESFDRERPEMKSLAEQIAATNELASQRKLFSKFTLLAGPMFKEALSAGTIYQKFCPMAFNNEGAYWYSAVPKIRNPYFGDKMLTCGKVTETIEK